MIQNDRCNDRTSTATKMATVHRLTWGRKRNETMEKVPLAKPELGEEMTTATESFSMSRSSEDSSSTAELEQLQQPSRHSHVRFDMDKVTVVPTESTDNYYSTEEQAQMWYSDEELQEIRNTNIMLTTTLMTKKNQGPDSYIHAHEELGYCFRGLENYTDSHENLKREFRILQSKEAVFVEQTRLIRRRRHSRSYDPESWLAFVYKESTLPFYQDAFALAQKDALEARAYQSETSSHKSKDKKTKQCYIDMKVIGDEDISILSEEGSKKKRGLLHKIKSLLKKAPAK